MYRVTASSSGSTLVISVTDNEGNNHTETMKRPKEFSIKKYIY
jgi:hypothetical protein